MKAIPPVNGTQDAVLAVAAHTPIQYMVAPDNATVGENVYCATVGAGYTVLNASASSIAVQFGDVKPLYVAPTLDCGAIVIDEKLCTYDAWVAA